MSALTYLLQVICISGLLYGYYHVALRNRLFHQYNRFYLLGSAILSVVLPFVHIPVYFTNAEMENNIVLQTLNVISSAAPADEVGTGDVTGSHSPAITLSQVLFFIYVVAAAIVLSRVLFSILKIARMRSRFPAEKIDNIVLINTSEPGTPYSFFRWLFWNRNISLGSAKGEQVFRHELFHIQQKHSLDVMLMEILSVVCWINPFFHLMKKEIRAIHEFLADEYAINKEKKWEYAELLLMQAFNTRQQLVNPFFHNQIKRRIAMITTSQKPGYRYVRKLMVLPIAAAAVAIFAFSYRKQSEVRVHGATEPITVVIDAGHGGEDNGAISGGIAEKDIVLAIAKKVKAMNTDPNITILLTRENDILPKLKDRTDFAAKQNSGLFLSLHLNTAASKTSMAPKSGIEIFLPKKGKSFEAESRIMAGILLNYMHDIFPSSPVIKQAETGIWVLDKPGCPSALIELGFMENKNDMNILQDPSRQEEIAKSILLSIDQYMVQKSGSDWNEKLKQLSRNETVAISDTTKPDLIFEKVEIDAAFPGGMIEWNSYLNENLNVKIPGLKDAPDGDYTVIVRFIVDTDGKLSDFNTLTRHGFGMEEEATRVIRQGPKWIPAVQNGKMVKSWRKQPVTFRVKDGKASHQLFQTIPDKASLSAISMDITATNDVKSINAKGELDPGTLYVGVENRINIKASLPYEEMYASISHGSIEKKGDRFIAKVSNPGDAVIFFTSISKSGKTIDVRKVPFKIRHLPGQSAL